MIIFIDKLLLAICLYMMDITEVNEKNCITINDVDKHPLGDFLEMKGYSWEDIIWG